MSDEYTLTLNHPLTEEQWDSITDVDFDYTDRIWFHTKHGKDVEFVKRKQWIPCSERLPEDNGNYLVTYIYKDDAKGTEEPYVVSDIFMPWKGAFATEEPTDKALAWMPLPDPWEGGYE